MKVRIIFSVIVITILSMGKANSQIVPAIQKSVLQNNDKDTFNQYLKAYTVFTMDKRELIDSLYKNGRCQFQIHIDTQQNWIIDLEFNDIRSPKFKQVYITDSGKFEYKGFVLNTFKGVTSNNQVARFTIDETNFFGIILDGKEHYVIRPAKDHTKNNADERLIVYKGSDIIFKNENFSNDDTLVNFKNNENLNIENNIDNTRGISCTYYLTISTDADFEFYKAKGKDYATVFNDILSVLNQVDGVYESTFNMRFLVSTMQVWCGTGGSYPYKSTNYGDLLDDFRDYWTNNIVEERNLAHLFSGKNFSVYGVAYAGGRFK